MNFSRTATIDWKGGIMDGSGEAKAGSGAISLPVSFPKRIGNAEGTTSPEELIAAAHASCFSMALSHVLNEAGTPPDKLEVSVDVTFVPGEGITTSAIEVTGVVPGVSQEAFAEAAESAKDNCPVSGALKGNVELSVDARLA